MSQSQTPTVPKNNPKLEALKSELSNLNVDHSPEIARLVEREIGRISAECTSKGPPANPEFLDLNDKGRLKIAHKVVIPVDFFPGYNFVGKLLGNKGENLKKLCTETNTRMAILGRGSYRDKAKEQECLDSGSPEHWHLREPLHVRVESHGPNHQVWANMSAAMSALAPYMHPDDTYVPPALPHWGWGMYEANGGYGADMGRGMRGGRGFFPRTGRASRGVAFRPGHRGGVNGGRHESFMMDFGHVGVDDPEDVDMEADERFANGASYGKMGLKFAGSGANRGYPTGRGFLRGPRGANRGKAF